MKSLIIDSCAFGILVISGTAYRDDLMIHPDGKILKPWRRRRGHQLSLDDLQELIDSSPEVIVVGTGMSGGMKPDKGLEEQLTRLSIEFIAARNQEAIRLFNESAREKRVGAGFHLTC